MKAGRRPPAGFTGWGSGAPPFCTFPLRVSSIRASALMLPLERMISHVFPWALT